MQILTVILEGHEKLSQQVSTAKDPFGRTVSVVPVLAGVIGDNMEIQRWLHGKRNTCHICHRSEDKLGLPGYIQGDQLKNTDELMLKISGISFDVLGDDHSYKSGMKTSAKERCKALGLHPSVLHPEMAPILRIKYFNAHQQVMYISSGLVHVILMTG